MYDPENRRIRRCCRASSLWDLPHWLYPDTERVLRTTNLSIVLGDQRVSGRLTKGLNADWVDLKKQL